MRSMVTKSGNDCIQTPLYLCKEIVEHYKPTGKICEPFKGEGNFLKFLPNADWYEIKEGKDFLNCSKHYDWIITNPPYSIYRPMLIKCLECAENIVFLCFVNATFMRRRIAEIYNRGFYIKEILLLPTPPKPWPQSGFQVGCVYFTKGKGLTNIINKC